MTVGSTSSQPPPARQLPPRSNRPGPAVRCRAAKACQRCNKKRVKCDAVEHGIPCSRCLQRNELDCVLIQSRRGIYARKPRQRREAQVGDGDGNPYHAAASHRENQSFPVESETLPTAVVTPDMGIMPGHAPETVPTTPARSLDSRMAAALRDASSVADELHQASPDQQQQQQQLDQAASVAGMTFSVSQTEKDTPSNETESSNDASYREISWGAMFDHFLDGQQKGDHAVDKCSITYLGESFPLSLVLKSIRANGGGRVRLHHPGPPCPESNSPAAEPQNLHHPPYMQPEDIAYLDARRTFELQIGRRWIPSSASSSAASSHSIPL